MKYSNKIMKKFLNFLVLGICLMPVPAKSGAIGEGELKLKPFIVDHFIQYINGKKGKKPAKSKKKGGRPKGMSQKTRQRYNWIRDKFYILKKKRSASTLDEMAGIIFSRLREKPPLYFEKTPYKKSTILKILKNKSWSAE